MADEKVTIYVLGKKYDVPQNLTIMKALEYLGYRYIRGCGCRGGFCGACGTVYRKKDSYKLRNGLACQTVVEDGMYIAQIPFFPAPKATYDLTELKPTVDTIAQHYPEIYRCVACNSCTKICPQEIDVMNCIQAVIKGDIVTAAQQSFDCIMCGLCAMRCPAEIVQYNVLILARRLYGKYIAKEAEHTKQMISLIEAGNFDAELDKLMRSDKETLRKLYNEREVEP